MSFRTLLPLTVLATAAGCADLDDYDGAPAETHASTTAAIGGSDALLRSYGDNGRYIRFGRARAEAMHAYPDGRALVAGYSRGVDQTSFYVTKLTAAGDPDLGFGIGGAGVISFEAGGQRIDAYAFDVAVDSEHGGSIYLGGHAFLPNGGGMVFALAKFRPDGRPDTGFGRNGAVLTDLDYSDGESINAITVDKAGRVVVVGDGKRSNGHRVWTVARYLADGRLDRPFGGSDENGSLWINFDDDATWQEATAVTLVDEPGPRIVIAGNVTADGKRYVGLFRLTERGVPDTAFGNAGRFRFTHAQGVRANDVDYNPVQDHYLVGGLVHENAKDKFMVAAVHSGVRSSRPVGLASDFGRNGIQVIDFASADNEQAHSVSWHWIPERIVVSGYATDNDGTAAFATSVLHPSGALDTSFHEDGKAVVSFPGARAFRGDHALVHLPQERNFRVYVAGTALDADDKTGVAVAALEIQAGLREQPCTPYYGDDGITSEMCEAASGLECRWDTELAPGHGMSCYFRRPTPPPPAVCGNGTRESGEACDDGNRANGDGCSSSCRVEQPPPPPPDDTIDQCASEQPRTGYVKFDDSHASDRCNGTTNQRDYNVQHLVKYSGKPVGATLVVCADAIVPAGWVVLPTSGVWNAGRCGHYLTPTHNLYTIQRVN